jgi:hypothetical protein
MRKLLCGTIACAALAASLPTFAAPLGDDEARLAAIERELAILRKENAALREQAQLQGENAKLRDRLREKMSESLPAPAQQAAPAPPTSPQRLWVQEPAPSVQSIKLPPSLAAAVSDPRVASAYGADMSVPLKALPAPVKGELNVFVEGGAFWTGGDPARTTRFDTAASSQGFGPSGGPFDLTPRVGWQGAVGFDYRFAGLPWHVSAQFRYGRAGDKADGDASSIGPVLEVVGPGLAFNVTATAQTTATNRESHWLADFAIGRDLNTGPDAMQVKVGFRVVELSSRIRQINNSQVLGLQFPFFGGFIASQTNTDREQDASFRGAGPRIGVEGAIPLRAGWQLDYLAGAAVLFGTRRFGTIFKETDVTTSNILGVGGPPSGFVITGSDQRGATVANVDLQAGLAYWVTPGFKVSASYRLDAYFGVLTTLDIAGGQRAIDRYFHGPSVAGTLRF